MFAYYSNNLYYYIPKSLITDWQKACKIRHYRYTVTREIRHCSNSQLINTVIYIRQLTYTYMYVCMCEYVCAVICINLKTQVAEPEQEILYERKRNI